MHFCNPRFAQCTGTRLHRRTSGENIVHNHRDLTLEPTSSANHARDIAQAFASGESFLAAAALETDERRRLPGFAGGMGQRLGQPCRLIERAGRQSRPVHGRRCKKIRTREHVGARVHHPTREYWQTVPAPSPLQIEYETARVVVVDECRACAVVGGFSSGAGSAQGIRFEPLRQWKPTAGALGLPKEVQFRPKRGLNDAGAVDNGVRQERSWGPYEV